MKKFCTILFLLLFVTVAFSQSQKEISIKFFSKEWKADSLGRNHFRSNTLCYEGKELVSLNEIDLNGLTQTKVFELLGEPNRETTIKGDFAIDYILTPYCGFSEEGCYRYVLEIQFKDETVVAFYTSFVDNKSLKHNSINNK